MGATMNPKLGVFLHDALDSLEHCSTVFEFYHGFQALQGLLATVQPWLPESYFATRFVYGLQPEYQIFVLRFRPVTVQVQLRGLGIASPELSLGIIGINELGNFLHDDLDQIEHTSSVEAFFHRFQAIKNLLLDVRPWLIEWYFTSRFIYGVKEDYQVFILRFRPTTVMAAYKLAMIYEEAIFLHYFPDNHMPIDEADRVCEEVLVEMGYLEPMSAINNSWTDQEDCALLYPNQNIPAAVEVHSILSVDNVCEEMVVDDFSSESITTNESPSTMVSQAIDTPEALWVVAAGQRVTMISSTVVHEKGKSPLDCLVIYVPTAFEAL